MEDEPGNAATTGHAVNNDNHSILSYIGNTNNAKNGVNTGYNGGPDNVAYTCKTEYSSNTGISANVFIAYADATDYADTKSYGCTRSISYSSSPGNTGYISNGGYASYGLGQDSSFDSYGAAVNHYSYSPGSITSRVHLTGHCDPHSNPKPPIGFGCVSSSQPGSDTNTEYGGFGPSNGYVYQDYLGGLSTENGPGTTKHEGHPVSENVAGPYPPLDEFMGIEGGSVIQNFGNNDSISAANIAPESADTHGTEPPLAGEPTYIIVGREGKVVKLYKQPRWDLNTALKHTPLAPKGTMFRWEDNTHIPRKPVVKGKVEKKKLVFEVVDTDGNYHERFFHRFNEQRWGNTRWISDANKWRSQTIRRLFKYDPEFKTNEVREKWSDAEVNWFKANVICMAKRLGRNFIAEDWKELADKHNERFSDIDHITGVAPASVHCLRTATGLRTKYKRFPDLVEQVAEIIAEAISSLEEEANETKIKAEENE